MFDRTPEAIAVMVMLVAAVWAYFAIALAPSIPLRWRSGWHAERRRVIGYLVVALVYGWFLVQFVSSGWLGETAYATTIEALAAVAQVALAAVLIIFTYRTVQANHVMAQETKRMAAAAVQQQRAATRPVLVFRLHARKENEQPTVRSFAIEVFNVGAGPALNTRILLDSTLNYETVFGAVQPLVIAPLVNDPEEKIGAWLTLREDNPFVDANNPMRWPANEDDATLIQNLSDVVNRPSPPRYAHQTTEEKKNWKEAVDQQKSEKEALEKEVRKQKQKYRISLANQIAGYGDVGQLRADYDDLAGSPHVSSAKLVIAERDNGSWDDGVTEDDFVRPAKITGDWWPSPNWSPLMLGPMVVDPVEISLTGGSDMAVDVA